MNDSNHLDDEPRDFDLSVFAFDEFATFIFRPESRARRAVIAGTWRGDAPKLDAESRVLLDVLFDTLTRILAIPNRAS
jgi:hypothetical protein